MGFVDFIQDHRWWVLVICLPLIVIYGRVLVLAALGGGAPPTKVPTAPVRRLPPKPQPGGMVKPSGMTPPPEGRQEVLPGSLDAGAAGHQKAGAAKTVKLPVTPPKPTDSPLTAKKSTTGGDTATDSEADALDSLFGKRDDAAAPAESATAAMRRKASRMEELGFHHGIAPATVEVKGEKPIPPMTVVPAATPGTAATPSAPPVTAAPTPPEILPGGTAPRSSTAELTSILERIDKFLAEDTPAKPAATLPPSKTATTAVVKTVSDEEAAKSTAAAQPTAPAIADSKPADKATEAMPKVDAAPAKPDPNKKTQPMWARADAQDEDIDAGLKDEKKPDGQQRLF
jgi:hypothetical protein